MKSKFILLLIACVLLPVSACTHLTPFELVELRREFRPLFGPEFPVVPISKDYRAELRSVLAKMQKVPLDGYLIMQVDFDSPTEAKVHLGHGSSVHGRILLLQRTKDDWIVTEGLTPF